MGVVLYLSSFPAFFVTAIPINSAESNQTGAVNHKAFLVTGASTGIGRKITEAMAANGYFKSVSSKETLLPYKHLQGFQGNNLVFFKRHG